MAAWLGHCTNLIPRLNQDFQTFQRGWFRKPVLGHVLGRHVPEHVLEYMRGHLLMHMPERHVSEYVLKHVPKHVLRHMLDKHVLNRMAHAVLMT